jgi:sialic acid synthase SpsE
MSGISGGRTMIKLADFIRGKLNKFERPYLIAEIGVNHEGNMGLAKRLIDEALEGGADAVKFQSYKAETIASKNSPSYWDTSKESTDSQYDFFKKYDKFWKKEFEALAAYCEESGIEFLSTPFDFESATFLNDMMDAFKISSSDITNHPFIEHIAGFGKPILLSTGASHLWEISEAVDVIEKARVSYSLMHCILNYPTEDENANLGMIQDLREKFSHTVIGYSDHTLPLNRMETLVTAYLLGARIIEKHFTHDKGLPGNDHYHAMDKEDVKVFRQRMELILKLVGQSRKHPLESEEIARLNARRSIVMARRVRRGQRIKREDVTFKRPAHGISPRNLADVIGKSAARDLEEDEILKWDAIGD